MASTSIIILATFVFSNFVITIAQPSLQIFSKQPPSDTFSVTLKATRPVVPKVAGEVIGVSYVCNNGGVWLAYREQNFTDNAWILSDSGCQQYVEHLNPINSVWLLESSKNTAIPTINLFPGFWWSDVQNAKRYTQNRRSYNGAFGSIVVTGSDAVTFYTEKHNRGRSVCLRPKGDSTTIFEGTVEKLGFKVGEIKSFRFGCFSSIVQNSKHVNNVVEPVRNHPSLVM